MLDSLFAPALNISLFECGQATSAILTNRLNQRQVSSPRLPASQLNAVVVLAPIRNIRYQVDPEHPITSEHVMDGFESRREIIVVQQRLKDAVRCEHRRKLPASERQRTNVASNEAQSFPRAEGLGPADCSRQHRRRPIDPDKRDTSTREWQRNATGSAPELEDEAFGPQSNAPPEWDVATTERLSVLPVVERSVLVPTFPAFAGSHSSKVQKFKVQGSGFRVRFKVQGSGFGFKRSVGDRELAWNDWSRARQAAESGEIAHEGEDADKDEQFECVGQPRVWQYFP